MNPHNFLDAVGRRPEWQDDGLCAQTDPDAFFPEKGGNSRPAKQICSGCPVKPDCLSWALMHQERFGIWGGTSERERRKFWQARPRTRYVPPTPEQVAQVWALTATGLSRPKIAAAVGVSLWTVKNITVSNQRGAA
jgi:WhiB family redox-sensing transcriptional regulator